MREREEDKQNKKGQVAEQEGRSESRRKHEEDKIPGEAGKAEGRGGARQTRRRRKEE